MKCFGKCVGVRICPRFWLCGESISQNAFRRCESGYRPEMPEMHLQNFEKLQSRKSGRNLRFFVFSCLHLNQTRIMCLQSNSDADFVLANLDAARWHTSPLVKQELASDRYLPGRNAMPVNKSMYFYCEQNLQ